MATRASDRAEFGRLRLPAEALLDLENSIVHPGLDGLPFGAVLNDLFLVSLANGNERFDGLRPARHVLNWARSALRPPLLSGVPPGTPRGRILVTWLGRKASLRSLVIPVLEALGHERCLVVGTDFDMRCELPNRVPFLSQRAMPSPTGSSWIGGYLRCLSSSWPRLRGALKRHGVRRSVAPRILHQLMAGARWFAACTLLMDEVKPRAVLTEYDRNALSSCIVLAARKRRIPTFTQLHGMLNSPYGYTPLVADRVLCWGERSRQTFIEYGVEPSRAVVVGHVGINRDVRADRLHALARATLPDKPCALLATNPIRPGPRRMLAEVFCEAVEDHTHLVGAVRLHPSERLDFYDDLAARHVNIRILLNQDWTLDESLAACEVVVCHNTGFALEALAKRRPVVILDAIDEPLLGARELIEKAGCPVARGPAELGAVLTRLVSDATFRHSILAAAEPFVMSLYSAFGTDAARNLAQVVVDSAERGGV